MAHGAFSGGPLPTLLPSWLQVFWPVFDGPRSRENTIPRAAECFASLDDDVGTGYQNRKDQGFDLA